MKKKSMLIGLAGLGGFLATTAWAFELIGPPRKWHSSDLPVSFLVNNGGETSVTDGDNGVSAVMGALDDWEAHVQGNLMNVGTTSSNAIGNDGVNIVSFEDPGKIVRNAIAVTLVGYYDSGTTETVNNIAFGRYLDTDISFSKRLDFTSDGESGGCSNEYHIESVTTHESGHALGLAHSSVGSALMYPSISACVEKGIASDDVDGINTIYTDGYGGGNPCTPSEARLGSLSCSAPNNGPNCMVVSASVVDDCGNGVGGASVTVQLTGSGGDVLTGTADTDGGGSVSFGLRCRNVSSPSYTVEVIAIDSSPAWDSNDANNATNPIVCVPR